MAVIVWYDITDIILKVALNTITLTSMMGDYVEFEIKDTTEL